MFWTNLGLRGAREAFKKVVVIVVIRPTEVCFEVRIGLPSARLRRQVMPAATEPTNEVANDVVIVPACREVAGAAAAAVAKSTRFHAPGWF